MTDTTTFQVNSTFVIRFYRSCQESALCWWGRIEHVQSGKRLSFFDPADMLKFIHCFNIDLEGREWSEPSELTVTNS
jgi:hypothetical protein